MFSLSLFILQQINNDTFCPHHARRSDKPYIAHSVFGSMTIDAVLVTDGDAILGKGNGTIGGIHRHNAFHGATVITSVADHACDAGCHILNSQCECLVCASPQIR